MKDFILKNPLFYALFGWIVGKAGFSKLNLYAKYLPYAPGKSILDLGCGPGNSTSFFKPEDYLGLDISEAYIHFAKSRYVNYDFICRNFLEFHAKERSFDIILAYGLIHHLPDYLAKQFFVKAFEVLSPD